MPPTHLDGPPGRSASTARTCRREASRSRPADRADGPVRRTAAATLAEDEERGVAHRRSDDGASELDHATPLPHEWSRRVELRDGSPVLLRQIRPEDRERLAAGLTQLSPASRYLRFHAVIDELTPDQLDYLTEVDHVDHEAIVAIDLSRPERPGVGVARYIREPFEAHVAESAITVADDYQGEGAGTILLGALAARAREHGITVFRNYVLDGNQQMLEVFDHLGATRELEADGLWRVDLSVPSGEDDLPDSGAGKAFLAVARGQHRLASLFPPVWSRLKGRGFASRGGRSSPSEDAADPAEGRPDEEQEELAGLRDALDVWLDEREAR
ncbi:N-acetyltransferase [Nitriliruptoraceae bacterium ZYF776]|nr:N-acetyltransferase [Profundirhabdus halotolerans]